MVTATKRDLITGGDPEALFLAPEKVQFIVILEELIEEREEPDHEPEITEG